MGNAARDTEAASFDAGRLYREVHGPQDGTPVLLLHGWGSSAALMQPIATRLAPSCRVHNVDMPGHGHSPNPPGAMGVPEHAALVAEYILGEMGGGPVTLVGHSNGGRIGLFMASTPEYAALFSALVLISPSGIKPRRGAQYKIKRFIASALRLPARFLPRRAADFFNDWITHSLVWHALGSSDYNALTGVMRETFVKTVNFFVHELIPAIRCPVLLLWGDRDTAISRYQIDQLESGIPDCGLVVLEGAGHYGHLDAIDTVAEATLSMISQSVGSGSDARPREAAAG